jgi:protein kinase-like protein
VTDFGLSVATGSVSATIETVAGTLIYMAPEVVKGQSYTKECDIWSAGVILYVMLCGEPPFYAHRQSELIAQIRAAELNFSAEPWPSISSTVKDLIRRLLRPQPSERYSAHEALSHPWITQDEASQPVMTVLEMMRAMQAELAFRKAGFAAIAAAYMIKVGRNRGLHGAGEEASKSDLSVEVSASSQAEVRKEPVGDCSTGSELTASQPSLLHTTKATSM